MRARRQSTAAPPSVIDDEDQSGGLDGSRLQRRGEERGGRKDGGCQSRHGVGGREGEREEDRRTDGRLASDQVAPISFSVAFTPDDRTNGDIGRADRMITMEMR